MRWLMLVGLGLALGSFAAHGQDVRLAIGYLELDGDARYHDRRTRARLRTRPHGRPYAGAQVALKEGRFPAAAVGVKLVLERETGKDAEGLIAALGRLHAAGSRFVLLDLPGAMVRAVSDSKLAKDMVLFNLSALDDELRGEACGSNLLHVSPSHSMLMDALGQYLVARKWRRVLVLRGGQPQDAQIFAAFERSAKRFGLKVDDVRDFVLGKDPRQRNRNNIALLSAGGKFDVVFVADALGEFAREVPYSIQKPRPVVGSAGLVADWWHWAWERHGAPQLNRRFLKKGKRLMTGYDWSAWIAVKAIVEALLRSESAEFDPLSAYLLSDKLVLDGFKGNRLNFRPWDRQLRQPLFLTTGEWVVERAPIDGFLHATNNMDTLGFDKAESRCRF